MAPMDGRDDRPPASSGPSAAAPAPGTAAQAPAPAPAAAVVPAGWAALRQHTTARIALGRAGAGLPTAAHLDFQLAHARARDAVHSALDPAPLAAALAARGLEPVLLHSAAANRRDYLQRPDLGRQLDAPSRTRLDRSAAAQQGCDAVFVLADGLSATAVQRHAVPLLDVVLPALGRAGWRLGPAAVVLQGRVAVGDEIGALLEAELAVVLIGERPGLSSPDSLGVYLTWQPHPGVTDAGRNCLSNIRPEGLGYAAAGARLVWLMTEARRRRLSGVALKEDAGVASMETQPEDAGTALPDPGAR